MDTFSGRFEPGEETIAIGPLAQTRMGGEPALMEQEVAYLQALQRAARWKVTAGAAQAARRG